MKQLTLTMFLAVYLFSVKGQVFKPDTSHHLYYNTLTGHVASHIPRFIDTYGMELDTIHNDKKSDFTVIGKDTVRNGIYEFNVIKKRLKKKGL